VTGRATLINYSILLLMGIGWGVTTPLSKIAVSSGYGMFGLLFWQLAIGATLMAGISIARGSGLPISRRALVVYTFLALLGTVIPDAIFYRTVVHLPSGVMSVLLSLIPMMAFPIALGLGLERFNPLRFVGLLAGMSGVMLLILPEASLPDVAMLAWIPFALITPLCYAFESNYIAKWGTGNIKPEQVVFGVSVVGAVITLPLALESGQFINPLRIWAAPEWALVVASAIHVLVYAGYVWLVGRAGSVFAVQVSYLVTGFGVIWAMVLLGESYSRYFWAALGLVLVGVFLVRPQSRPQEQRAEQ